MKFINLAFITFLQTAVVASAANTVHTISVGGDAKVSCAAGDQCCITNDDWTQTINTGVSSFGAGGCDFSTSAGEFLGCKTGGGCAIDCSSGCNVESSSLSATNTASTVAATTTEGPVITTDTASTAAAAPADANGFVPISGDFSQVSSVTINPDCPYETMTQHAKPNFTIQPSESAYVSSYPANLVVPIVSGTGLSIQLNAEVAKGAQNGGVQIGLPPDQFSDLTVGNALTGQILDGFTSVQSIDVSGSSKLHATMSSSTNSDLGLIVSGSSTATVITNAAVSFAEVSGMSTVTIESDVTSVDLSGASRLYVSGNVDSGTVSGVSTMVVTGDIQGSVDNSGVSTINANTVSGSIDSSGVSQVNAASCGSTSFCNTAAPPSVNVDASTYGMISTGTSSCKKYSFGGSTFSFSDNTSGSSRYSSAKFAIAAAGSAASVVAFLLV